MKKLYLSVLILVAIFGYSSFAYAEEIDFSSEDIQSQNIVNNDAKDSTLEVSFDSEEVKINNEKNDNLTISFNNSNSNDSIIKINSFSNDTGKSDTDHITSDTTPTFTGTAHPNTNIILFIANTCAKLQAGMGCAGLDIGTTTSDADGNWSIDSMVIADGSWEIVASEVYNGNALTSDKFLITIDTQKPIIENVYIDNGAGVNVNFEKLEAINVNKNNPIINVVFSSSDYPLSSYILLWDLSKVDPTKTSDPSYYAEIGHSKSFDLDTNVNFDLTDLSLDDGSYRVMIQAKDAASNKIDFGEKTFIFNLDTVAPEAPVITSPISQEYPYSNSIEVSGTCDVNEGPVSLTLEDVALYKGDEYPKLGKYFNFGGDCINGKFNTKIEIENNSDIFAPVNLLPVIKFAAVQFDKAGNMSEMSNIITLTHKNPVITSISNEIRLEGQTHVVNSKNPKLYGIARPNATIQLFDTVDIYAKTTSDDKGNFVFESPFKTASGALELGEYYFLVCEIDYGYCYTPEPPSEHNFNVKIIEASTSSGGGGGGGGGSSSNTIPNVCSVKILGDINCDSKVNKYDFSLMMAAWGFKTKDKADLNDDISVDKYDFALLMSNWGYGEIKR